MDNNVKWNLSSSDLSQNLQELSQKRKEATLQHLKEALRHRKCMTIVSSHKFPMAERHNPLSTKQKNIQKYSTLKNFEQNWIKKDELKFSQNVMPSIKDKPEKRNSSEMQCSPLSKSITSFNHTFSGSPESNKVKKKTEQSQMNRMNMTMSHVFSQPRGMSYSKRCLQDGKIQHFILKQNLDILIDKVYQIKLLTQKGLRLKVADVVKFMPLSSHLSITTKIQDLCGRLYYVGNTLLQELQNTKSALEIDDIEEELSAAARIEPESRIFSVYTKLIELSLEHFSACVYVYYILNKWKNRKPFQVEIVQEMLSIMDQSRLSVNQIYQEYSLCEATVEKKITELRAKYRSLKQTNISKEKLSMRRTSFLLSNKNEPESMKLQNNLNYIVRSSQYSEDTKIEMFIKNCLDKIIPRRVPPTTKVYSKKKKIELAIENKKNNLYHLGHSIDIIAKSPIRVQLKGGLSSLLKELKEEYRSVSKLPEKLSVYKFHY